MNKHKIIQGLVGGMIGDSVGLYYENLKKEKVKRKLKNINKLNFKMFLNFGIISDDTEHSIFTLENLIFS